MRHLKFLLWMLFASVCFPAFAETEEEETLQDGTFEIYTVEDLYEFASIVNSGNRYLSARVMNDIVVNENVLDAEGNPTSDTFRVWTPIKNDYSGVFDGNGHVISGLYIPNGRDQWSMFISIHGGTIKNLGVEDSYYSNSQGRSGGICGQTWTNSVITNCYFKGVIKCGGSEVGGITSACHNGSVVSNCFSMAKLSGASAIHGICPVVSKATVENCYYLEDDFSSEVAYADSFSVLSMTTEQFADGEVCYKLNKGVTDGTQVFFQNLDEPREDTLRVIDLHPVFNTAHLTVYANDTIYYNYLFEPAAKDSIFEIYTVEDLYEFARIVNSGNRYLSARVMNDIVVNENVLDAEGNPTSDTFRVWTPIKNDYSGVFDGNGHVISGLYIPNGRDQWSMFISIHGGTIKNLGVEDSYYSNSQGRSGGICGQTWTNSVITNCYFKGVIKCGGSEVGGITSACHNGSVVSNCFSMAKLSGASAIHGICPVVSKATVENCYYLEDDFSSEVAYADSFSVLSMTTEQFADGEVCYKLNKGVTDGTQVFFQNLDEPRKDTLRVIDLHPVFNTAHLTVYTNDTIYYNYLFDPVAKDSIFEIYTVEDLYEFASIVNSGNRYLSARVMNDIVVNENVLDAEGNPTSDTFRVWTPIKNDYSGVFDGNGHVISGLYIPNGRDQWSMFISIHGGTIKNLGVEDSYYSNSQGRSGGICGQTWTNSVITNCYFKGVIKCGGSEVGGITSACHNGSVVSNCFSMAKLSGASAIHGICPVVSKATVENCYYLEDDFSSEVAYADSFSILPMTTEQFADGEVCYKLNKGVTDGTQVFFQNLDEPRKDTLRAIDLHPVFDTAHLTVYANDTIYYNYLIEPAAKDSIFEIYTVEDLYEFARIVNSGNRYLSARVMNDIVVNENVLDAEGNPTSDTFRVWTPIKNDYSGVFDGNGHVISGLYIPNGRDQWSMFISIHGGTIKNLGVEDSYYSNSQGRSGGICGQTWTNSVITNCYFKGVIKCGGSEVGGITSACHNGSVVSNCFSMAKLSGASAIHGICPVVSKATVENCYYLEDDFSSEVAYADSFSVLPMTPDQFADGEVCYKLNEGVTDGTQVFFQNLDEPREDTLRVIDLHPVFDTAHLTVYANDTIYYNYLNSAVENLLDESGAVVYVEDYTIVVSGAKGYLYLSDMNGNVLFATQKREETSCVRIPVSKAGVYVVVVDGASCKVLVR